MDITTTLQTIETAIVDDETLAAWCSNYYGRDPSVFLGTNPDEQPAETSYPLIAIYPSGISTGWDAEEKIERIIIVGGLNEDDLEEKPSDSNISMTGVLRLAEFVDKIFDILKDISFGTGAYIKSAEIDFEPAELWPYLMTGIEITISYPLSQGSDVFA